MGKESIVKKLSSLPFQTVSHNITKCDPQPVIGIDGGKSVFVSIIGKINTDSDPPKGFFQTFLFRPANAEASAYFIAN